MCVEVSVFVVVCGSMCVGVYLCEYEMCAGKGHRKVTFLKSKL